MSLVLKITDVQITALEAYQNFKLKVLLLIYSFSQKPLVEKFHMATNSVQGPDYCYVTEAQT